MRCLRYEYGIDGPLLSEVGSFSYFARDGAGAHCENEHCTLFIGELNEPVALNPEVGYGYRWVSKPSLLREVRAAPERYAPWALLSVSLLLRTGFFERSPGPWAASMSVRGYLDQTVVGAPPDGAA
jgi:isopentenyldiphosphate isomerase